MQYTLKDVLDITHAFLQRGPGHPPVTWEDLGKAVYLLNKVTNIQAERIRKKYAHDPEKAEEEVTNWINLGRVEYLPEDEQAPATA